MRKLHRLLAAAALALWAAPLGAQEFIAKRLAGETLVTELIGQTIYSPSNDSLGAVSDLILDQGRTLTGVVIAVGEREVAVPYRALLAKVAGGEVRYVLSSDAATLASAPDYVREDDSGRQLVPAPCGGQCPGDPMANPMPAN